MFSTALLTSLGIYILFLRLGMRKVLHFGAGADLTVSIGLGMLLAGTFSGFVLAALSGLFLSGMLYATRLFVKPKPPITLTKLKSWIPKKHNH